MPIDKIVRFKSNEAYEKIKKLCDENNLSILKEDDLGVLLIGEKDIWEGCEFAEYIHSPMKNLAHFKIVGSDEQYLYMSDGSELFKDNCKPSTESAYIEQLKKEAHERFGEIKEGDRFDRTTIDEKWGSNTIMDKSPFGNFHWKYDRSSDTLFIGRFGIYSKGKWATRVKERIEVTVTENNTYLGRNMSTITLNIGKELHINELGKLAQQLENYLNEQ